MLVARLAVADSELMLMNLLSQLERHTSKAAALAAAGALPVLLYLVDRSSKAVQHKAVQVLYTMAGTSIDGQQAAAGARSTRRPDAVALQRQDGTDAGSRGSSEAGRAGSVLSTATRSSKSSVGAPGRTSQEAGALVRVRTNSVTTSTATSTSSDFDPQISPWITPSTSTATSQGTLARSRSLVAALLSLINHSYSSALQAQAAGALANLALGSPARQREIVAAGGVALLTTLLARSTDSVAEAAQRAAAAALCNVAASSLPAEEADSAGEQLALLIQHSSDERARQVAADALRNLTFFAAKRTAATAATDGAAAQQEQTAAQTAAGGRPQAAAVAMDLAIGAGDSVQGGGDAAQAGAVQPAPATPAAAPQLARIQPLIELLRGSDSPAAQSAAAAALANIAATSGDLRTAIGSKAIPRLVELLGSGSPDVQQAAATALLNCAAGSPANQTAIRAEGGVEALEQLPGASYSPGVQDVATALLSTLSASSLADASRGAAGVGQLPAPDSGDEAAGVGQLPAPDSDT